jgi:diaminohydroxyphosphoribosylaminopyrimidine deaminase/5-amino-6-(5-phosphoribosylamino)uracil reductase
VVGRGWHRGPGTEHAEAVALRQAGKRAAGATLFCTLEPCSHQGNTPPCADALVAAGIERAVIALRDPNPLVDGRGLARLRAGGVRVEMLDGAATVAAQRQNAPFLKFLRTGLPLVTYKAAVSLDGKVAASGGDARWISSEQSRRRVHRMRAAADAVMVGAGTVRHDDPELTVRLCAGRDPVRVVVSRSGALPLDAKVVRSAGEVRTLLLAGATSSPDSAALAAAGVEVVPLPGGRLRDGLAELARRGMLDVLFEGGPTLAASLLAEGLLDRVTLFVAPLVVGHGAPDLFAVPAVGDIADGWHLRDVAWRRVGDDMMMSGRLGES